MLTKDLVRPNKPLSPISEPILPLDQYMVRIILPMMCVFQLESPLLRQAINTNLKAGLASTLDEMRFLAATIIPDPEEFDSIQLEYDADEAGVWFYTQELPGFDYHALAQRDFAFSALPETEFVPHPRGHTKRCPVLTVLVTFITGGAVVTFNGHHAVMDAQGLGTFAQTWAKHVAAESEGRMVPEGERLTEAMLDASSTLGAPSIRSLDEFPPYKVAEMTGFEKTQRDVLQVAVSGDHEKLKRLVQLSHWYLSPENLISLVDSAVESNFSRPAVTENAIVSAFIWRHMTKARRLSASGVARSSLFTSVNVRRRMDPPLAVEYPGNAIVLGTATASTSELELSSTLYAIARKIGDSIEWWTPNRIWELTGAIDACDSVANKLIPSVGYDILVTSPSRLGDVLKSSKWGSELGSIKALRFAFPAFMDGFATYLPGLNGGLDIMVWTNEEVSGRLREDNEWAERVKLVE